MEIGFNIYVGFVVFEKELRCLELLYFHFVRVRVLTGRSTDSAVMYRSNNYNIVHMYYIKIISNTV